jgi:hypothetical protein
MDGAHDYGEPGPPPRWLEAVLGFAAEARAWAVIALLVWLVAVGGLALSLLVASAVRRIAA